MERFGHLPSLLKDIDIQSLGDIAIVMLMIYTFLIALKRTRRSGLILVGIVILGAVYLAARKLNLMLTVWLLQGFFTVILVALVVIFQEDLRYFFERVGIWWFERRLPLSKRMAPHLARREVEILARTMADLARAKIGALVVIRGKDSIARHLNGGVEVKGLLSEPLLKSIFDPHSLGHDGAVVIDGTLIDKLGCHLPLSKNLEKIPLNGTRHAAALGLAELCDALCLVVSQEQGTISVARHGGISTLSTAAELAGFLEDFYEETMPPKEKRSWGAFLRRNSVEKAVALGLAVALWIMVGYSAEIVRRSFEVPVKYDSLPANLTVDSIEPTKVLVTFSGKRKAFAFLRADDIKISVRVRDARQGQHRYSITNRDLSYPSGLELEDLAPRTALLQIGNKQPGTKN